MHCDPPVMLDPASFDESIRGIDAWRHRLDAPFWLAFSWAEGERRDSSPGNSQAAGRGTRFGRKIRIASETFLR